MPQQVAVSEKDVINGRAFPSLLMWIMMLCSGLLVLKDVYKIVKKQPLEWKIINLQTEAKALVIFGILFITYMPVSYTHLPRQLQIFWYRHTTAPTAFRLQSAVALTTTDPIISRRS